MTAARLTYAATSPETLSETPARMIIGGTIVERREFDEVLTIIASRLQCSSTMGLAVGSVNLDHLYHFRKVTAAPTAPLEWLLLADGMPIAWRGQLLTAKPWPRVTGADLLPSVLALAEKTGARVGFFGGSAETHRLLAGSLRKRYPALAISGMWSPNAATIGAMSDHLAAAIHAARTDILIVSLGKPRQEQWVDRYGCATGSRVFLACGGAIDFLAGRTSRAPGWMQRIGLEWLHRLAREPRRLARRYLLQGPIALLRTVRAQLICYPNAYCVSTPRSDHADIVSAVRDAARPKAAAV
ncbi:N-acetylglucosaminyldiphosphoundecaprenol N-acetyl-beta-D-mannosaminyltransferase [Mycobacterium attenuatum]|uniref:N-acetylglucosaminyldiphosphoundecaprenol N-acetyl-beta-D-mannosaminyltransferase n=1 Tax=Mycobacterium attenuatum TaxID=2341086 RepID=A0A498QBB5_9MYCO|nr:WecB/TagA/CpsF family glycosyltransferase [Mycobacterium attenuatum]VBA42053.1 N-acetylglucosaminyldiphosphoundecaprenol N-acetyl-beta-D-mannosaminyltransferase [Mycobacterium attenuatum]